MKRPIAATLALALICIPSMVLAAPAQAPAETVGVLLLRLQEESAGPLIQHCAASVPSLKRSLEAEYSQFRKKFRKATAPLRAGIGTNDELSRPAPREVIKQFEGMDAEMLLQIQKLDPHSYCPMLKANLARATLESIRKNMESAFAQYSAVARQNR